MCGCVCVCVVCGLYGQYALTCSEGVRVVWAELLADCGEGSAWACSLKWRQTNSQGTSYNTV